MNVKKRLNNRGFLLVETLIVSVFIMSVFALLYTNFFPLVGEYNRYRTYDTIESVYVAHWARKIALRGLPDSVYQTAKNVGYVDVSDCSLYSKSESITLCNAFKNVNQVSKIYLTSYSTVSFKNYVENTNSFARDFREYITYLPRYVNNTSKTPNQGYYRVIVEYQHQSVNYYGTTEVYHP